MHAPHTRATARGCLFVVAEVMCYVRGVETLKGMQNFFMEFAPREPEPVRKGT